MLSLKIFVTITMASRKPVAMVKVGATVIVFDVVAATVILFQPLLLLVKKEVLLLIDTNDTQFFQTRVLKACKTSIAAAVCLVLHYMLDMV